jgi:histidine ammonia-lyase
MTNDVYTFLESRLTVEAVASMADAPVQGALTPEAWQTVERSRAIVERVLRSGAPLYGATTGIGSQKDVPVGGDCLATFGDRMIISEATDYPGPAFAPRVVRAALVVLINNLAKGRSGVRPVVIRRLLQLLAGERLPSVRQDTSYGSADLMSLEMAIGVWAIARRGIAAEDLGEGVRAVHAAIRPLLHIGQEGSRIFDMAAIVAVVRKVGFFTNARGDAGVPPRPA